MVIGSCYSFQGKAHILKNIACQDASRVEEIVGDWTVMATADGVGSCPKSDIGSKTAVNTAVQLCLKAFPFDGNDEAILSLLRTAFNGAMREITKVAKDAGDELYNYDTTLDIVIFNGSTKVYYGHCGDGGIFVLNSDGDYNEITSVQEGAEANSVVPLRNGNASWKFGIYEDEIAVVAAFTDGIRDKISSPLLEQENCTIDVPLANMFMFVDAYGMEKEEASEELRKVMKASAAYLRSPKCQITDDVTMGILVNTEVLVKDDPAERYVKPDWVKIWANRIEKLYPNQEAVTRLFRRHKLEQDIVANPDKIDLTENTLEALLDRFYPLTDTEVAEYAKKYHKETPAAVPDEAVQQEAIEKPEQSTPVREQPERSDDDLTLFHSVAPGEDLPPEETEKVEQIRQNVTAEDLNVPIVDSSTSGSFVPEQEGCSESSKLTFLKSVCRTIGLYRPDPETMHPDEMKETTENIETADVNASETSAHPDSV